MALCTPMMLCTTSTLHFQNLLIIPNGNCVPIKQSLLSPYPGVNRRISKPGITEKSKNPGAQDNAEGAESSSPGGPWCGLAQIRGLFDLSFVSKNDHSVCCPPQAGTELCLLSVCPISPSTSPKVFKESTLRAWDSYWDTGHMTHYLLLSAAPSIIPVSSPPETTERLLSARSSLEVKGNCTNRCWILQANTLNDACLY